MAWSQKPTRARCGGSSAWRYERGRARMASRRGRAELRGEKGGKSAMSDARGRGESDFFAGMSEAKDEVARTLSGMRARA